MTKRAHKKHPRRKRDHYGTPQEAAAPLFPFLAAGAVFYEPCAAEGLLVDHLTAAGFRCAGASDIHPLRHDVGQLDALALTAADIPPGAIIITNPPWDRVLLHQLILHLSSLAPTWLLFDADWMHLTGRTKPTRQWRECYARLRKVVSVGRVKWVFEGSKTAGFDNAAFYYFDPAGHGPPRLYGQGELPEDEPQRGPVRLCVDCHQPIGSRDRWRMVRREGVSTVVHMDCEHPRGTPGVPLPMALFPDHDKPVEQALSPGPGPCAACAEAGEPLASGAYYCQGAATWAMPDGGPCPQDLRLIVHSGGSVPQETVAGAT